MTQTFGSTARVKWDRKPDRLNPARVDKDFLAILELCITVRRDWEHAADLGAYAIRKETGGRGTGFHDTDPTHSAAVAPTRRQVRRSAAQAAELIQAARQHLQDASDVLHAGLMRTDPETLTEFLEKRAAATQARTTRL